MVDIDFHADDFALSKNSDDGILELCRFGLLDSISVMPNLSIFEAATEKFNSQKSGFPNDVKISIHLNFMEGRCIAPKERLPHLVDEDGFFTVSWGRLLFWNYNPFLRKKIQRELEEEITAQTNRCIDFGLAAKGAVRFDSHQHPHMIPIVFDALCDAIRKNGFAVEYIRNAQDPMSPYLKRFEFWKTYSVVNFIKCIVLNFYSTRVVRRLKKMLLPISFLSGVFLSGRMDLRLKKIIPPLRKKSEKAGRTLEILFHPGTMLQSELSASRAEFTKPGFNADHTDEGRKVEFDAIKELRREFF